MKARKHEGRKARPSAPVAVAEHSAPWWPYGIAAAAIVLVLWAYGPAMHGPFLFDDAMLPFAGLAASLRDWVGGVRPVLMITYWLNAQLSGEDTFSYHLLNLIFHCVSTGLIFLIVRRLLVWSGSEPGRRDLLAGAAAAVYLLHPMQTEAVAYLAGRSDGLSVMLFFAAFCVFLYRRDTAVSWGIVVAVFLLFAAALGAKEHTITLPVLLLLTDFWWNPGFQWEGVRRNWKLYLPLAAGAVAGAAYLVPVLIHSQSAGFHLKDLTWYQYFFTQCRALFVYIGLFLLPVNQRVDWDFPTSRTILDHGAIAGLAILLALAAAAWHFRRKYRLAAYGFFVYLLLMAPTSSILPIADAVAERRLYLSMLGLLLIAVDVLDRVRLDQRRLAVAAALLAVVLAAATHARARVWSTEVALWEDTVQKSPNKPRAHFQLASSYCGTACGGAPQDAAPPRCDLAVAEFQKTAQLKTPDYNLLVDWALAYDCLGQPENALAKLRQAAALEPTAHVYTQIAMVYAKRSQWADALDALSHAEKLDANFAMTYYYKGGVHLSVNQPQAAVLDYQRALAIDPKLQPARDGLAQAQARLRSIR